MKEVFEKKSLSDVARKLLCEFRGKNSKLKNGVVGGTWQKEKKAGNYKGAWQVTVHGVS